MKQFLLDAPSHLVFTKDGMGLVVAVHAGIRDGFIGRDSKTVRDFCRYGDTDGFDESGKPIRKDWFLNHASGEFIIWGHDPRPQPMMVNNTINLDQGVVFGGSLTAFRYPEKRVVSVKARHDYSNIEDNPLANWNQKRFGLPNIQRYLYGYYVDTEIYGHVKINSGEVKAAIDSVSHYTVPIEELVYIPPTMSPASLTSDLDNYLEHPREAFEYYRAQGVNSMVVEKKHMGSRAIVLLFRNPEAAVEYIGRLTLGTIYSRTGRPFFDIELETQILEKLNSDLLKNGYFQRYETDFVLLDTEILPWNLKAKELISSQYAHVAEAAILDREKLIYHLNRALGCGREVGDWLHEAEQKLDNVKIFREVFENYCWDIQGIKSIQIAPFHTLAHSSETFFDRSHLWHMEKNQELAGISTLFVETEYRVVTDELSEQDATEWWVEMTGNGHEGFVVKPEMYISRNAKGELVQPAIKVRGQKYLHIIYGIDYLLPENLKRIKKRNVGKKQRHALMEFALGVEGVTRFVNKDTVERIHDCVLGTLALEEEPVDPRL
jgi:polynucleotide kinase-phosphatase